MRRLLPVVLTLIAALVVLAAVIAVRAARLAPGGGEVPAPDRLAIDPAAAADRLAAAVRVPTVTTDDGPAPPDTLARLHALLADAFPRVHAALEREVVAGGSLLFRWPGSEPDLPPLLLLAHLDVVPPGADAGWSRPPFAGVVAGGRVHGRGTLDDKGSALAILEAVEALLADGFRPRRTTWIALGHDEERGGREGAGTMAGLLERRGVRPAMILDEGLVVLDGLVPGIDGPVALVGIAEKGSINVVVTARGEGGHSMMPPGETAVVTLARAVERIADDRPEARLAGIPERTFRALAPHMAPLERAVFANLWLFRPVVLRQLAATPRTDALLRTTTAPTMLEGSPKTNVLPTEARAVINFRIHPRDTAGGVVEHVRAAVEGLAVEVAPLPGSFVNEPSPVSPDSGPGWDTLTTTIRQTLGTDAVAPSLVIAATDARHYVGLSEAVYRFAPYRLDAAALGSIHGTDETIEVDAYAGMIRFYAQLIRNAQAGLGAR